MSDRRPRILWGITGSVAAIRAEVLSAELASLGDVQAVATTRAMHFLRPLSLGIPLHEDADEWDSWTQLGDPILHIELRRWADLFIIAPATADALAKMANGLCDNLLLSVARAWDFSKPMLVAPAMNTLMWDHPSTVEHLRRLESWGVRVISPVVKELACQDVGMGALAPPTSIREVVTDVLETARHG